MSDNYTITIVLKNVAQSDAEDVAQRIWDEHAEDLDAGLGDFDIGVAREGRFDIGWEPQA